MSAVGLGAYGLQAGGLSATSSPSNGMDISTLMPAFMNVVNQTAAKAQTPFVMSPLDEHKAYWRELSAETRAAIEADDEYQATKMQMLQEFLIWCVGGTELGAAFAAGPGANVIRELTSLAKKIEPQVGKQRNKEVEDLRNQVAQLTQYIQSQAAAQGQSSSNEKIEPSALAEIHRLRAELGSLKRELGVTTSQEGEEVKHEQ